MTKTLHPDETNRLHLSTKRVKMANRFQSIHTKVYYKTDKICKFLGEKSVVETNFTYIPNGALLSYPGIEKSKAHQA